MKRIKLHGRGSEGLYTIVDDDDFIKLHNNRIRFSNTRSYYAIFKMGPMKNYVYLHRFILGVNDPKVTVDHVNRDRLDNRKCNLRICTKSENLYNQPMHKNNKSGYKGVYFIKDRLKTPWRAQIVANKKRYVLGRFKTAEEASIAYKNAVIKYHGDFAFLD